MSKYQELDLLMQASLRGDSRAHKMLLDDLSGCLRAYYKHRLLRTGRSAVEAEDLVQEALIAIHTRRHTYDVTQPLMPWVYAIARYKLIDHLRQTRNAFADVPIEAGNDLVAHNDHAETESALDVAKLLARLPARIRLAVQSVKLEGLSSTEAAKRYGTSEAAIKTNVHRGLKALAISIALERTHENK